MIVYKTVGPDQAGDFLIGYATPGAPHVLIVAGTASTEQAAKDECARLNEAQVITQSVSMVRTMNAIVRNGES